MFSVTEDAVTYILQQGGHVCVTLSFEPSMGGCCKGDRIWGSYIPQIGTGKPAADSNYLCEKQNGICIWYAPKLKIKPGYKDITIYTKKFLVSQWLEIEGAQGYSVLPPREQ